MKAIMKTQKELLRAGWKENVRAIHWRMYHPLFGGSHDSNWGRNPGRLDVNKVENMLGKEVTITKVQAAYRWCHLLPGDRKQVRLIMVHIEVSVKGEGILKAYVPKNALKNFRQSDWDAYNKFKKIKAKFGHRDIEMSLNGEFIKVGCTKATKENALKAITKIAEKLGYKITKRRK